MIVKFNDPGEFIEELKREYGQPGIAEPVILRLTTLTSMSSMSPNIHHVSVVATFKDSRGDVVKLEKYVGDVWGLGQDDKVWETVKKLHEFITTTSQEFGIDVRAGVLEPEVAEK